MLTRAIAVLSALLFGVAPLAAQPFPQNLPDHTVVGRLGTGTGTGPWQAIPFATLGANITGKPWCDPNGLAATAGATLRKGGDDVPYINQCITNLAATGGGTVYLPAGQYCQRNGHFVDLISGPGAKIELVGEGITATQIVNCDNSDVPVVKAENRTRIANLLIQGYNSTAANFPALWVTVDGTASLLENLAINYGKTCLTIEGVDTAYFHVETNKCFGASSARIRVPSFGYDAKFDQGSPQGSITNFAPNAWASAHAYSAGNVVSILSGTVWIQAMANGTSGSVEPVVTSYATTVADGTATWQLYSPSATYSAIQFDPLSAGYGEEKIYKVDASGVFTNAITVVDSGGLSTHDIMVSGLIAGSINGVLLSGTGQRFTLADSEMPNPGYAVKTDTSWGGSLVVIGNVFFGNSANGIYLTGGATASITGNVSSGTYSDAFLRAGPNIGNFTAMGNSIASGSTACLKLDAGTPTKITFIGNNCNGAPNAISATTNATTAIYANDGSPVPVVNGGTGLAAGISGGVPFFSSTTTMLSSSALGADQIVLGGGAGAAPIVVGSLGTTTTTLHGNAAGAPSFGPVVSADMNITPTTCTNQVVTAISAGGVGSCATVANAALANSTITISGKSTALGASYAPGRSQSTPGNPATTASTAAFVMAGLAGSFTPATSGNMLLMVQADLFNDTVGDAADMQIAYGTGSAPANAAAATGTLVGNFARGTGNNLETTPTLIAYVTGLSAGTTYWFDVQYKAVTGGNATIRRPVLVALEQ